MTRHPPDDTENFLGRWSRRKTEAREPQPAPADPAAETVPGAPSTEPVPAPTMEDEIPPKTDADMPPIESIDEQSDISDFFSPGVSDALRQAALHKLFRLPKFNVVDALDDYNEDFTTFAALGDIITADMRHRAEVEAERLKEKARQALADEQEQGSDSAEVAAEQADADETEEPLQQRQRDDDSRDPTAREERAQPPLEDDVENT